MTGSGVRVMIADDHDFVRGAIRDALRARDIHIVAEAATTDEARTAALEHRPDVLLLDIDLGDGSGLDLLGELSPRLPATRIVLLTASTSQRDVMDAMRLGAAGYLTKDLAPDALQRAVRGAATGHLAMTRRLAATTMRHFVALLRRLPVDRRAGGASALTIREQEILRLLAEGLTDRQMADRLSISTRTVETHVANILRRLGARNRAEAASRYTARPYEESPNR